MDRMDRISAWLDGEMSEAEARALEAEAEADPTLAAEMEALKAQDEALLTAFDALLDVPVPGTLVGAAEATPVTQRPTTFSAPANSPHAPWLGATGIAAALVLIAFGAGGGALVTRSFFPTTELVEVEVQVQRGWMAEIADYHRVYARQSRHLAEVPASEQAHIETWLAAQTGVTFTTPDLSGAGFQFEGARLLVAAGKPVVQLLYRDEGGGVLALCALQSDGSGEGFEARQFGEDVEMVRWFAPGAAWVAVGTPDMPLEDLARAAAQEV